MTRFLGRQIGLAVLFVIFTASSTLWAQDSKTPDPDNPEAQARSEQIESSTNLRESVHENLETLQEDSQVVEDLRKQEETQSPPAEQPDTSAATGQDPLPEETIESSAEQTTADQPEEKKHILDYLQQVPIFLQSVPDRVPFIRDRNLIFFGRTEVDYAHYSSGITASDSGFRLRSLRVGLAKAYKYNLSAKAEIDLTDGDSNFADLYIRHRHKRWGLLTLGNQRVAQTLVNQTSRISRTFMEEPLPAEAFGLGRRMAVGWDLHKKKGGIHLTFFGSDLNGSIGDSGYAGRVYFNPTRSRFSVFHVGASLVSENMSRKTRFYSHPESRVTDERLVDTGIYDDVTHQYIGALEIAGALDSFMFRSEFFAAKWQRNSSDNPMFRGFYVQASWVLTGEEFKYTQGKFIRIRPQKPKGAWEVAARFSRVDLNDQDITGGEENNLSIAVNWYAPANQFRMMANVIFVRTDEYAGNEDPTIIQVRAQFHW